MKSKKKISPSCARNLLFKKFLEEYVQRYGLDSPVYNDTDSGSPLCPKFTATVLVDGVTYKSRSIFNTCMAAHEDVARIALRKLLGKTVVEDDPIAVKVEGDRITVKMECDHMKVQVESDPLAVKVEGHPVALNVEGHPLTNKAIMVEHPKKLIQKLPNSGRKLPFKKDLEEYAQIHSLGSPVYTTVNCGSPSCVKFTATVLVDGVTYSSPSMFDSRKAARQDVARIALEKLKVEGDLPALKVEGDKVDCDLIAVKDEVDPITVKVEDDPITVKVEGDPITDKGVVFCKGFMHELSKKLEVPKPLYTTLQTQFRPVDAFVSYLEFKGIQYKGQVSLSKEEAEETAARAARLSLSVGGDSKEKAYISKMIEAGNKHVSSVKSLKDQDQDHATALTSKEVSCVDGGDKVLKRCALMDSSSDKKQLADGGSVDDLSAFANIDPSSGHASVDISKGRKRAIPEPDTPLLLSPPPSNQDCSLSCSTSDDKVATVAKKRRIRKKKQIISEEGKVPCQSC